jgi:hypothetical protein
VKSNSLPITAALPQLGGLQLPILWVKELRVILPVILGCAASLLLSPALPYEIRNSIIHLLYPLTCSAVFAFAFGHDYLHRTLTTALAQPIERRRIFWMRMALCITALLPLATVHFVTYCWSFIFNFGGSFFAWPSLWNVFILVFEPILNAICLAPCLTILSRSILFGTIISMTAPFALAVLVRVITLRLGFQDGVPLFFIAITASSVLLITGAFLTWRKFMTQEAIETDVAIGANPRRRSRKVESQAQAENIESSPRQYSPVWQLIKKEFMLQRLPIGISILATAVVLLVSKDHAALLSLFYPATIIVLVGSIASADERRLGLIPSQVTHPISFRVQWLTKIAVSYMTAMLCGVALPCLALISKTDELKNLTASDLLTLSPLILGGPLLILSVTIYVSSISDNAIRAMLASLFVIIISTMAVGAAYNAYAQQLWLQMADPAMVAVVESEARAAYYAVELQFQTRSFVLSTFGFIPLALYFAMENHRYLERNGGRLFRQVGILLVYELAALVLIFISL